MRDKITRNNKYGLPQAIARPQIKASKSLNLASAEGQQIIKSETKLALKTHMATFKRLADM
ncbi:hypothetical protein D0C16_04300 [Cellvibrio sp. KY-GH-1]|uniref:hypothetical protein n=1 Tax=Cellvibrio sp. KY-GH-1 TaxID=2303332 RepID=UPI0012487260|nr:hypothetical protein [Cellvibrio sp. KY-GH-1]QEY18889.1 hypothetical protein D0C16_04300 [Cellvibrio sp. KY-GH-1]